MSDSPWLDIPHKENVKAALLAGGGSRGSKYESVVRAVEQYQAVPKDEHPQFITRAMLLRKLREACLAARGQANSAGHQRYLDLLRQRADAKAMYLDAIFSYLAKNADQFKDIRGFLEDMSLRRMPTPPPPPAPNANWQRAKVGGGTFAMQGGVGFEKLDPYHREFEVHHGKGKDPWGPGVTGNGVGGHMVDWARLVLDEGYDKPFLAYLEITDLCHYSAGNATKMRSVRYAQDGTLVEDTVLVTLAGGGKLDAIGRFGHRLDFDTTDVTHGKGEQHRAKAYVWTVHGDFIVGVHETGKIHHSSFVGGGVVRCAGMIGATAGRVHYVDGNSGHYRPDAAHLHALIIYLTVNHLFTGDACTDVKGEDMTIDDYLFEQPRTFIGKGVTLGTHRGKS